MRFRDRKSHAKTQGRKEKRDFEQEITEASGPYLFIVAGDRFSPKLLGVPNVLLSIADSHLKILPEVVRALEKAGLKVSGELNSLGIVRGFVEPENMRKLSEVDGVSHVREEKSYRIAPPDSPIQ